MFPSFKSIVFQFLADWGILIRFEWTYKVSLYIEFLIHLQDIRYMLVYNVEYNIRGLLRKLLYRIYASNTGNIHVHKYNARLSE